MIINKLIILKILNNKYKYKSSKSKIIKINPILKKWIFILDLNQKKFSNPHSKILEFKGFLETLSNVFINKNKISTKLNLNKILFKIV